MIWFKRKLIKPITKSFYALGTINNITIYQRNSEEILQLAMQKVYDIDGKMSVFDENSEIFKVNKNAGITQQKVSKDTFYVIKKAIEFSNKSEKAMDITIKPLVDLWRLEYENMQISDDKVNQTLKLVDSNSILLDESTQSVFLQYENQSIDLGSIAKGYAADRIKAIFSDNGVENAIINLGGNIIVMGSNEDGKGWKVGVQNPDKERGISMGAVTLRNKAIVTSGGYERFQIINGKKFHHIINPKTGYPSDSGLKSVTIISDDAIDADALSTSVFVLGLKKASTLLKAFSSVDAILITDDDKVYLTKKMLNSFELSDDVYSIEGEL